MLLIPHILKLLINGLSLTEDSYVTNLKVSRQERSFSRSGMARIEEGRCTIEKTRRAGIQGKDLLAEEEG